MLNHDIVKGMFPEYVPVIKKEPRRSPTTVKAIARQEVILEIVQDRKLSASEIAKETGFIGQTVKRDIAAMLKRGEVTNYSKGNPLYVIGAVK